MDRYHDPDRFRRLGNRPQPVMIPVDQPPPSREREWNRPFEPVDEDVKMAGCLEIRRIVLSMTCFENRKMLYFLVALYFVSFVFSLRQFNFEWPRWPHSPFGYSTPGLSTYAIHVAVCRSASRERGPYITSSHRWEFSYVHLYNINT